MTFDLKYTKHVNREQMTHLIKSKQKTLKFVAEKPMNKKKKFMDK